MRAAWCERTRSGTGHTTTEFSVQRRLAPEGTKTGDRSQGEGRNGAEERGRVLSSEGQRADSEWRRLMWPKSKCQFISGKRKTP